MDEQMIKWSEWCEYGMLHEGYAKYSTLKKRIDNYGIEAKKWIRKNNNGHLIYARIMRNEDEEILEVRFYVDIHLHDLTLKVVMECNPNDILFVLD